MAYQITEGCIRCGACVNQCPFGAIGEAEEAEGYQVDPDKCAECDMCDSICPIDVIRHNPATEGRRRFLEIHIISDKCIGCSLCARVCPVKAIHGQIKSPYEIDPAACIRCGACLAKCRKEAIAVVYEDEAGVRAGAGAGGRSQ